jgi:uncharacterized protein (DUF1810 family)
VTLFWSVCPEHRPLFKAVMEKYFKGEADRNTLLILRDMAVPDSDSE